MNKKTLLFLICCSVLVAGCNSRSQFPVERRYWTPEDYADAIWKIQYKTPEGQQYPRFSDPESGVVIQKLVDAENHRVILDDSELGLNYRNEMAEKFRDAFSDLDEVYGVMDIQDKYVYPEELIAIKKFGLGLEVRYFRLGNDRIIDQADDPKSDRIQALLELNEDALIKNFNRYLDEIGDEKYYGPAAHLLADGVAIHFFELIEAFPTANYNPMFNKAKLMANKTEVPEIREALNKLVEKLRSMRPPA